MGALQICRDPDDDAILEAAIHGKAQYLGRPETTISNATSTSSKWPAAIESEWYPSASFYAVSRAGHNDNYCFRRLSFLPSPKF